VIVGAAPDPLNTARFVVLMVIELARPGDGVGKNCA
jgi:hypothetical protein